MTPEQYQSLIDEWNRWNFLEKAVEAIRQDAITEQVRVTRKQFEHGGPGGVAGEVTGDSREVAEGCAGRLQGEEGELARAASG